MRIYYGVGGFLPSSVHLIGEIFDRVYPEAGGTVNTNVQRAAVAQLVVTGPEDKTIYSGAMSGGGH